MSFAKKGFVIGVSGGGGSDVSILTYKGVWNASTNTPTITQGSGTNGDGYLVSVAGTWDSMEFKVGDAIAYNGSSSTWQKLDYSTALKGAKGDKGDKGDTVENTDELTLKDISTESYSGTVTKQNELNAEFVEQIKNGIIESSDLDTITSPEKRVYRQTADTTARKTGLYTYNAASTKTDKWEAIGSGGGIQFNALVAKTESGEINIYDENGDKQTLISIKALFNDTSKFLYLTYLNIVFIPSSRYLETSSSFEFGGSFHNDNKAYSCSLTIDSTNTVTYKQIEVENAENKVLDIDDYDATNENQYFNAKTVDDNYKTIIDVTSKPLFPAENTFYRIPDTINYNDSDGTSRSLTVTKLWEYKDSWVSHSTIMLTYQQYLGLTDAQLKDTTTYVVNGATAVPVTISYNSFSDLPTINGVTVKGTLTLNDLNLYSKPQVDDLIANLTGYVKTSNVLTAYNSSATDEQLYSAKYINDNGSGGGASVATIYNALHPVGETITSVDAPIVPSGVTATWELVGTKRLSERVDLLPFEYRTLGTIPGTEYDVSDMSELDEIVVGGSCWYIDATTGVINQGREAKVDYLPFSQDKVELLLCGDWSDTSLNYSGYMLVVWVSNTKIRLCISSDTQTQTHSYPCYVYGIKYTNINIYKRTA